MKFSATFEFDYTLWKGWKCVVTSDNKEYSGIHREPGEALNEALNDMDEQRGREAGYIK